MRSKENTANGWTVLWSQDRVKQAIADGGKGKPLTHLFGGPFTSHPSPIRFKVKPNDNVYVVSVRQKQLFLMGRITVQRVMPLSDWAQRLAEASEDDTIRAMKALGQIPPPNPQTVLHQWLEENKAWYLSPRHNYSDAVVEGHGTPLRFDVALSPDLLSQVSFVVKTGEALLLPAGETQINMNRLQGMYRRLTPSACQLLDTLLPHEVPKTETTAK